MPQSTVASHTTWVRAHAGCSARVEACLSQLIEPTLQMPGCLHVALQQSRSEPLLWHVAGYWQDEASMLAYFKSPLMEVYSVLVHTRVIDSLDFQTGCDEVWSSVQKRAG